MFSHHFICEIAVNRCTLQCQYRYFDCSFCLENVWTTKCSDNHRSDNRGSTVFACTVISSVVHSLYLKVWSIALVAKESRLVVGSSDRQLRVWAVEHASAEQEVGGASSRVIIGQKRAPLSGDDGDDMISQNDVTGHGKHDRNVRNIMCVVCAVTLSSLQLPVRCNLIGSIKRETMDRLSRVRADPCGVVLLCQVSTCDTLVT